MFAVAMQVCSTKQAALLPSVVKVVSAVPVLQAYSAPAVIGGVAAVGVMLTMLAKKWLQQYAECTESKGVNGTRLLQLEAMQARAPARPARRQAME